MKIMSLVAVGFALAGPVSAQSVKDGEITVSGEASVERPAEWAVISLELRGEGKTEVEALRAMSALRAKIEDGLPRLKGMGAVSFETGVLQVQPVRSKACDEGEAEGRRTVLSQGACAPVGAVAQLALRVKVGTPARVGDASSLAAEMGAQDVQVSAWGLTDGRALEREALRQAIIKARDEAQAMATAAERRLGPVLRLQDSRSMVYGQDAVAGVVGMLQDKSLVRAQLDPAVPVELTVRPVTARAQVAVTYSLQ